MSIQKDQGIQLITEKNESVYCSSKGNPHLMLTIYLIKFILFESLHHCDLTVYMNDS